MFAPEPPRDLIPEIHSEIRPCVRTGLVTASPVHVRPSGEDLERELREVASGLRERYAGRTPAEIEPLAHARELYRAFGIDPTRTRPSSEALLRRVLKGAPLPRICNAVDVCNLCSLRFLLPIGLYDVSRLEPPLELRRGRPGESYAGIRKDEVHLEGRPVLTDRRGPFGNPTSDSLRSSVTSGTEGLLMVIFAPASYSPRRIERDVEFARGIMGRHLGRADEPATVRGAVRP